MKRKFILTNETLVINETLTLHRIKAVVDFGDIKAGTKGGYVQSIENLSQDGLCWVADSAFVYGFARVSNNAIVKGKAIVRGYARVYGNAIVRDYALLKDSVHVFDNAVVGLKSYLVGGATASGNAQVLCKPLNGEPRYPNIRDCGVVTENAQLLQRGVVRDKAILRGNAVLQGRSRLVGNAVASDNAQLNGSVRVMDDAWIFGDARLFGFTAVYGKSAIYGRCKIGGRSIIACNARVAGSEELIDFRISGDQCYGI